MLFMGIDVGTQGVRCVVSDAQGGIAAAQEWSDYLSMKKRMA